MAPTHGFDADAHLTLRWRWLPVPPLPRTEPLPSVAFRDDDAFFALTPPASEMTTFRFSFPQLAKLSPDLRFYRLIQQLNTPLLSMTTREAGHTAFAYWRGAFPKFRDDVRWAHFWFFRDDADDDLVVIEYGFEGGLTLYSRRKSTADLAARYAALVACVSNNTVAPEGRDGSSGA